MDVLSEDLVARTLTAVGVFWKDRIYTPLVTLWVFLSQVLSADHSCRAAVARLIAHLISQGKMPCSAQMGAYCQARERLPEKFFSDVACSVGRELDAKADHRWLWNGRRVYRFDGMTVSMPDTPENQKAYPQVYNQKSGLGFPIARSHHVFVLRGHIESLRLPTRWQGPKRAGPSVPCGICFSQVTSCLPTA